ncbi:hypothetical protein E2C01_036324 [Portunus trituberculatus]|uniref:Uncharacterized protein n=1 Tax=Portunus trituberculatus TaxID=210409 RepID=A0A5B7FAW4_PORTR|nr:hypothetical protein [Portunus trituberculatus]
MKFCPLSLLYSPLISFPLFFFLSLFSLLSSPLGPYQVTLPYLRDNQHPSVPLLPELIKALEEALWLRQVAAAAQK